MPDMHGILRNETVLVTGASGFLGGHLIRSLLSSGACVVALSRRLPATFPDLPREHWIILPAWTPEGLAKVAGRVEWTSAVHAAAYGVKPWERSADEMTNINARCAMALARLAAERRASAYIHIGSCSEYAEPSGVGLLSPESPPETVKLYGASKAKGMLNSQRIAAACGMAFAGLRLFNIYGPGEAPHRLLPSLCRQLAFNQPVALSHGMQIRDFCFVEDAADAIVTMLARCAGSPGHNGIHNVCTGQGTTVRSFAEEVARQINKSAGLLAFGAAAMRSDELARVVGDPSRLHAETGWVARTSLHEGIRKSVADFQAL